MTDPLSKFKIEPGDHERSGGRCMARRRFGRGRGVWIKSIIMGTKGESEPSALALWWQFTCYSGKYLLKKFRSNGN